MGNRKYTRISAHRVSPAVVAEEKQKADNAWKGLNDKRPTTRLECVDGPRPCPWVACRYHLYLDVNSKTGSLAIYKPASEVIDMKESCALDVADAGGKTLEEIGAIFNCTRERVRQEEEIALYKYGKIVEHYGYYKQITRHPDNLYFRSSTRARRAD